jgi:DNA-binding transcriptional ArsR family regulator
VSAEHASNPARQDVLVVDRPEQLKALGHPLRLRVLEMLGTEEGEGLTNRELAQRLEVDPGHLHFHVRMLLRAGLIQLSETSGGREKPYRSVARTIRVAPELIASGEGSDLRAAMLQEVELGWQAHASAGRFRIAQVTARLSEEQALHLITELVERARDLEDPETEPLVLTTIFHPPTARDG